MADIAQKLFLILPLESQLPGACPALLDDPAIACALVRTPVTGADAKGEQLASLVSALQSHEIAVLCEHPAHAAQCAADGVLANIGPKGETNDLKEAIRLIKPQGIVGAAGLASRHDAMTAGETNIDFVMFGEPQDRPPLQEQSGSHEETTERASWWSELFTIPCVAYAAETSDITNIATSGCEFIALSIPTELSLQQQQSRLEEALDALRKVQK